MIPHTRFLATLRPNFVLEVPDQLSDVRVSPRQHIANDRSSRHATPLQFRNRDDRTTNSIESDHAFIPHQECDKIRDKFARPGRPHAALAVTRSVRGEP